MAVQITQPDILLSEVLAQLGAAAQVRSIPLEKLLTEVLGRLAKKAAGSKLVRQA